MMRVLAQQRREEGGDVPRLTAVALGVGILLAGMPAGSAQAEDYPLRPIRVVVGFGPGAVADVILRVMATRMSQSLGQQLVVELPDHRKVTIKAFEEDDNLINDLIENNAAFRAKLAKSASSKRKPFQPSHSES